MIKNSVRIGPRTRISGIPGRSMNRIDKSWVEKSHRAFENGFYVELIFEIGQKANMFDKLNTYKLDFHW